jgi:fumarate reductase flavoprotein subunit
VEIYKADVVIVGGGGAGLRAAIAVAESDPSLKIALVSKVYPMRSHTVAAEGGAAGVKRPTTASTITSTTPWVAATGCASRTSSSTSSSRHRRADPARTLGLPVEPYPDGHVNVRAFGGMKIERTWFAADKTGFHILHTLFQTSIKYPSIKRFDEYFCVDLLEEDGRVPGRRGHRDGHRRIHHDRRQVGHHRHRRCRPRLPRKHLGGIVTGDGMALAFRHGVALRDMEFVQYHPTCMPITGLLFTEACRGEGGYLVNKDGYRYLQDYGLGRCKTSRRTSTWNSARATASARRSGTSSRRAAPSSTRSWFGGSPRPAPPRRSVSARASAADLRNGRNLHGHRSGQGADPGSSGRALHDGRHQVDGNCAASLPGLYAIGECASVGIHGANRLGSNSLTELLVFGKVAGDEAAPSASRLRPPAIRRACSSRRRRSNSASWR